jgi:23S rRNA (uracil1939-C5)-methyltransferase
MGRNKKRFEPYHLQGLKVKKAGSEGISIAFHEQKVVMLPYAVPGDVVDVRIVSDKKNYTEGVIEKIIESSPDRINPFCEHHGTCGGCKWQQMSYASQLRYKQQQVQDAFERIGKFEFPTIRATLGSNDTTFYRNKVEFSFTDRKWLTSLDDKDLLTTAQHAGLGFHIPGRFDKVFDVNKCWLMDDLQNSIRNHIKAYCIQNEYPFFNLYKQTGFMRSIILRNNAAGQWMLIVVFANEDEEMRTNLLDNIIQHFPQITSLQYVINTKRNDTIHDQIVIPYTGDSYLIQKLDNLEFKMGPKSFFQTNTAQTQVLYDVVKKFANLTGNENVYDLYTGVGTIALYVSRWARKVIGVEYVTDAIEDAKRNAAHNDITHTHFFAGDMKDVLNDEFIHSNGMPDVIITDPPRAGMHESVVQKLLQMRASKIVYVSCNPATQARDIALLSDTYNVRAVQPVDMFPHTHHVECVVLLELK